MFLRTVAHLGGRREEIGILSFFGGPDAGVGAVGSSYCCSDFIEQEVSSEEVLTESKTQWQTLTMQNFTNPSR